MQNGVNKNAAEQPAPNISADFLTGSTEIGLERIRTRLLDLTNRNKLLNFRHSNASSLRVVAVQIDPIFTRLRDGEKLPFSPVPQPEIQGGDGQERPAKDYADALGWNTSFDLDDADDDAARFLPALHYQESLDTVSRKIASAANTAIEESGTNMLYLVFGFLEWYESDDSQQPHLAPLVVVPVTIERTGGKGRAVDAVLEYSGEDVDTNLSLVEKMRRDFGLEIPILEDDEGPEAYFVKFGELLKIKKHWRIRRQITLALLSFGKLLMYRDLDPKTWPVGQSIAKHALVRELFEGSKNPNVALAEEFPIDDPELKHDIPLLIRDADSSQHSALVHALRGQNLVIEGPPGTGKSQTITNLIASALAKGKTVLFVSEKLAALEVVRRRLDDAGLGMFCLEVHSHKTKKGALLNDLAQRQAKKGTFRDPRDLDRHLSIVEEKKRLLTQYAALINKVIEPSHATIFDILWARDRYGQGIAAHRERLTPLTLPVVTQYTPTQFTQTEHLLSVYTQHLSAVLAACTGLDEHPWAWITKPLGFADEEHALSLPAELRTTVQRAEEYCDRLHTTAGIAIARTVRGLELAAHTLIVLPESGTPLVEDLLAPCQSAETRHTLAVFVGHVEAYHRAHKRLSASTTRPHTLFAIDTLARLSGVHECLHKWGLDGRSVAEIKDIHTLVTETATSLSDAHTSYQAMLTLVGCDAPASITGAAFLVEAVRAVESAPFALLHLRHPAFEHEHTKHLVTKARDEAAALKDTASALSEEFDLTLGGGATTTTQLLDSAVTLLEASLWQRIFGRNYRTAVNTYRRVARKKQKTPRSQMSRALRDVAQHVQQRSAFDNHPLYGETLGTHFQGVNSAWDDLRAIVAWYEQILVTLPEHQAAAAPFRRLIFTARIEHLKTIKASTPQSEEHRAALTRLLARIGKFTHALPSQQTLIAAGTFNETLDCLHKLTRDVSDALQTLQDTAMHNAVVLRTIPEILEAARQCCDAMTAVQADGPPRLLGNAYRGINTAIEPIKYTVQFAKTVATGNLPRPTVEWLLHREHEGRLQDLRTWLRAVADCARSIQTLTEDLATLSGSAFWSANPQNSWSGLLALAEHALSAPDELTHWNHYLRLQIATAEAGLTRLTTLAQTRVLDSRDLVPAFHFVYYNTLARSVFTEQTDLSQITGVTQELLRKQFAAADKEAIRLYSERVAALIDQRQVPYGNQSGPVRTWTDMALVTHEINKQKRHIPIRQLLRRAANALVALKPCFMMGPLSVAQYLAPGQLKFDLVVMDEASQLKPEDAIGALARGGQVVIVGDPKQLPPTSFFQRVSLDDEDKTDEDRTAVEEGESILDVASTLFQPVRRLRWHYRSRHHSLIAFSNEEFYQRDLIIFPSAYHDDPSLGVKHHFINDGVYENSRNPREAAVVVDAVLDHMRNNPTETLGVVTLNFEQRELVEELLDRKLRDDPAAIAYQETMQGGQETLFVKNLENVQGDERDVIFISTTYGPDARGNQYQRFGPINGANGHRRLNVLFTRSKKRTVVFSSLDPERIQTTANSPWGVRALKQYLIYARTGILQQADNGGDQPTNDFERSIGAVLKEHGYVVTPQVGVAGFFIDLGVRHPCKPGAFLLGIECDGASYHSGRSARDRDRLRQEILENLGWKIHRIWSTDWFKSRTNETTRLLRRIEELLAGEPDYVREMYRVQRLDTLRAQLVHLRDKELRTAFPDSAPERCLLRSELLDAFVNVRPRTKEEWFQKIAPDLHSVTESKQVGQFLPRVLEIINASFT